MDKELKAILPLVQKPIRYTNGEYNSIIKEKNANSILFALIFPDLYEIGMSNYGLKILYHILNREPSIIAERAYAPWPDFGKRLKQKGIPLYSLETKTPLSQFHILGFSLQSELSYTNLLYILDLAKIPLRSEERNSSHPLVIAGGPCCVNPLPMSKFIDAFCIGDGEEVVREICAVYQNWNRKNRADLISSLAKVEGVYVPLIHENSPLVIKRRLVKFFEEEDFPFPPVVPICEVVHDRLTIEVMRGCTRGCRFCQAGIINRPARVRKPEEILRLVERGIRNSGWEEVSLLAFSVSDYPNLLNLLTQLNALLYKRRVAISLPSMRGEEFSLSLAQELKTIKKTGLTFAPETISRRLKGFLNKEVKEESIFQALANATAAGWLGVKLYFMVGLPDETEEDVKEIGRFVTDAAQRFRQLQIRFSVSPFVPKPHTPLQWAPFSDIETLLAKLALLKRKTRRRNIQTKWENPYQAQIQAIFARGDKRLNQVILTAYQKGAIFTEWSEFFNYRDWLDSFQESGVDPREYLRKRPYSEVLPWDFIDVGVKKEFLRREAEKAERSTFTSDCRQSDCSECGACPGREENSQKELSPKEEKNFIPAEGPAAFRKKIFLTDTKNVTYRVKYTVGENFRYASHLDIVRQIYRILRRSELPVAFSSGFSPHPLVSFGPPLPVGVTSRGEYCDLQVAISYSGNITRDLAPFLPKDMKILETRVIRREVPSLGKAINLAEYWLKPQPPFRFDEGEVLTRSKKVTAVYQIDFDRSPTSGESGILIFVRIAPGIRLFSLLSQLFGLTEEAIRLFDIERRDNYVLRDNKIYTPLEDI